ncbi:MAG TPA: F0F1 ATP synthase subunit epsilon [Patescibacteria group bacterium]|nr:F0F1 ATP synthase subunit epsilon [Patescibacteria group bacterium]
MSIEKKIHFEITTPEKNVYRDEVESVSLPTTMGQITVLANHIPLVASIEPGELIIRKDGKEVLMAISGGMLEVKDNNHIIVLADTAEHAEEIDEARAEEARKKAEGILKEKMEDATEYAAVAAKLQRELARLRVARKHRTKKGVGID